MPRIRCHYIDCVFLEENYCGAAAIELDPDTICLTYSRADDLEVDEVERDEEDELEEWDETDVDEEDDENWADEDEI